MPLSALSLALALLVPTELPNIDVSRHNAKDSGASAVRNGDKLTLQWSCDTAATDLNSASDLAFITFDLASGHRLIDSIGRKKRGESAKVVAGELDPALFVTVGTRESPADRPADMSVFNVFFDSPAKRPHESFVGKLDLKRVSVASVGFRTTVTIGDLTAGPFRGEWRVSVHRGNPLIQVQAAVKTDREKTAYLYDTGLVGSKPIAPTLAWTDTEGVFQRVATSADSNDRAVSVRHRLVVAESEGGSLACFPEPHRYFFPRDLTDNLGHVWHGRNHRKLAKDWGLGIRQFESGGGNYVPWINAPPGTEQRLGVFYLPLPGKAEDASKEVLRFTRNDRFADVPGHVTFTTHWHMAITIEQMKRKDKAFIPDFVKMFKDMNVQVVHLGEFHGDGHPNDVGPVRLAELKAMFDECRRLSDDKLLFLPGEEANVHLGVKQPGKNPGHYMCLFPKPVYWVTKHEAGQPFESNDPAYGKVYRVGNLAEMEELLRREEGLAWTAHPRIKASNWTPDIFRNEAFYKADTWLGAAWKAMPSDLSRERLGDRCLDLLSDMANWGDRKYMPAEVDVFKVDHTHELFGHMNINYLKLEKAPTFDQGWKPVLDALRTGKFWSGTGEILIPEFSLDGKGSGESITIGNEGKARLSAKVSNTFPIAFVEVVSGDGSKVYRERTDIPISATFGESIFQLTPKLAGRTWARFEIWDIAGNGAFTQPVWIDASKK